MSPREGEVYMLTIKVGIKVEKKRREAIKHIEEKKNRGREHKRRKERFFSLHSFEAQSIRSKKGKKA